MNLFDEMIGPKEVGDPVEGVVVDQDRAEQGLFRIDVVRRRSIGALLSSGLSLRKLLDGRHGH